MKNKIVRLTEQDLHNLIKESVAHCLNELDWRTYQSAAKKMNVKSNLPNLSEPEREMNRRRYRNLNNKMNSELYDTYDMTMDDYDDAIVNKKYDDYSDKQLRGIAAVGRNKRGGDEYISGKGYMNK